MRNTLVIGDTHLPFERDGYLDFCRRIYKQLKCSRVIHIGDLVDNHAISYHEHDPDGWSPEEEMKETDKKLRDWFKAFPDVYLCRGNHDAMVDRKGKTVGLPKRCFRQFRDMWNLPKGWKDDFNFVFDGVLYTHGTGYTGKMGHILAAFDNRMSCVTGHLHSVAGVEYLANSESLIFGMAVGCGIDDKKYAFEYGKGFRRKPIVSAGVVSHTSKGTNATVYTMDLGGK
jgi:predicted phosphodiesterase